MIGGALTFQTAHFIANRAKIIINQCVGQDAILSTSILLTKSFTICKFKGHKNTKMKPHQIHISYINLTIILLHQAHNQT
jgi:hypothetical protein